MSANMPIEASTAPMKRGRHLASASSGSSHIYCTYCDHRYLPRAVALLESLRQVGCSDELWIVCMTEECHHAICLLDLSGVHVITLSDLEAACPHLLDVKPHRETIEYYYTCTAQVISYVFANAPKVEAVTYVDSDMWFFANPEPIFAHLGDAPVAITPHNFVPRLKHNERFGVYNVGWVTFRRDQEALRCLNWWAESCLEWCYGRIEDGRFGDQKYLERFVEIAPHTKTITFKGCNTGPWNIENYDVHMRGSQVMVDEYPLIAFHFHGVKRVMRYFYFSNHRAYGAPYSWTIRNNIYRPYVAALLKAEERVAAIISLKECNGVHLRSGKFLGVDVKNLLRAVRSAVYKIADLSSLKCILVWKSRAL